MDQKYIGMILAILSSIAIGSSFVLTKIGLNATSKKYGSATKGMAYVKNHIWWMGMTFMVIGELSNFAAYSFAPAILVTPLGALSVIVGAIFASFFLGERINHIGKCGIALCLLGSLQVVLNSPEDPHIDSVMQIMDYAVKTPFLLYTFINLCTLLVFVYVLSPRYGLKTPIVYLTICSIAGSFTVVACKALGIALKLTFSGHNQLFYLSTYVFFAGVLSCIAVQLNYFNKALEIFNTNIVTPTYYVLFTTLTIVATTILFQGFSGTVESFVFILSGFFILFIGVYLLNTSKESSKNICSRTSDDYSSLFDMEDFSGADMERDSTRAYSEDSATNDNGYTKINTSIYENDQTTPIIYDITKSQSPKNSHGMFTDNTLLNHKQRNSNDDTQYFDNSQQYQNDFFVNQPSPSPTSTL
ncbi:hypothetical protein BB561_005664 [Smittium simulii]|uniref:Magnesium transporter n=1 Tax=Smittium simulii TaxID=133385 RepID=A0A2T9Y944_9FUNG|nr:hypothetical protein BB561_005664 [Smittium simulii]